MSEWRFGPHDPLPRELVVEGALPWGGRADVARYVHVSTSEITLWMGADPLAELLAGIARQDIAATRVACRRGKGLVASHTPDTLAVITGAIAPMFPALRVERVCAAQGEPPVACVRGGERVELDQLSASERSAIHMVASIHAGSAWGGVVLAALPNLAEPADASDWLDWLAGLATAYQLQVIVGAQGHGGVRSTRHKVLGSVRTDCPDATDPVKPQCAGLPSAR